MNLTTVIDELKSQRDTLEQAVFALERLRGPRRGRPPGWLKKPVAVENAPQSNGRKPFSLATRRKMAQSQKKRWAQARKVA